MAAPIIYQAAFNTDPTGAAEASTTVDASSINPLAPVVAGRDLLCIAASPNNFNNDSTPGTISDTLGNNFGSPLFTVEDTTGLGITLYVWHAQNIIGGTTAVTHTYQRNVFPQLAVFEIEASTVAASGQANTTPATTSHIHASPGLTATDVAGFIYICADNNADFVDLFGTPLSGYTRIFPNGVGYYRRYALQYIASTTYSADTIPINATLAPRQSYAVAIAMSAVAGGPQPPQEVSNTPDLPASGSYTQGQAINVDVSGNWVVGSGGTAPLTFTASAAMTSAGLAMSGAGVITGTATFANAATGLTYTVDDAANNGPTTSSTFDYNVANPAPVETTPTPNPLNATSGVAGSYDASANWLVGPGGSGPLTFTAGTSPAWPTGLTISAIGLIEWTGAIPINTYAGLSFDVDDAASNGPVTSATFDFVVAAAGAPTVTTPPADEVDGTGSVVEVRGLTSCTVETWDAAGARVARQVGVDQLGSGQFQIQDPALTGPSHFVAWIDPSTTRCGICFLPAVAPTTNEQSVTGTSPTNDYVQTLPAVEVSAGGMVENVRGLTGLVGEAWDATGARVARQTGLSQEPDGTLIFQDAALSSPTSYYVAWMDPTTKKCGIEYLPALDVPDQRVTESGADTRVTEGSDRRITEG